MRQRKAEGADVIKIFASASIRDGGTQTMSDEQLEAICGEAKAQGLRTMVHAHSAESIKASVLAGCNQIEHGVFADDESLKLMAERGVYFDPQICLVSATTSTTARSTRASATTTRRDSRRWRRRSRSRRRCSSARINTPGLKIIFGTDAVAGAHGRNAEELVCRVQAGGQSPIDAITSATSLGAEALRMGNQIGIDRAGLAGRSHRGAGRSDERTSRRCGA